MKSVVLEFKEVSYRAKDEKSDLTEVSFSLRRGQRASLQCSRHEQFETIWRLLQTNLRPHKGNIDAPVRDQCYSNRLLETGLNPYLLAPPDLRIYFCRGLFCPNLNLRPSLLYSQVPIFLKVLPRQLPLPLNQVKTI